MNIFDLFTSSTSAIIANIFIALIIPTLWKETNVPNGLGKLRKLIFVVIISIFLGNIVIAYSQVMRYFHPLSPFEASLLSNFASCARIINGIVIYLIWSERYHPHKKP